MFILFILFLFFLGYYWFSYLNRKKQNCDGLAILALADFGLCPRMQNHALAVTHCFPNKQIYLIGYHTTKCSKKIHENPNIKIYDISGRKFLEILKKNTRNFFFPIYAGLKVFLQTCLLFFTLIKLSEYNILLVQNTPAIPTLFVSWLSCRIKGAKFYIDWHNYSYSTLDLTVKKIKLIKFLPIISISKIIEKTFGQLADYNFCVSKSMQNDLKKNWFINSSILYDRPLDILSPISLLEKHKLIYKYINRIVTDNKETNEKKFNQNLLNLITSAHSPIRTHLKLQEDFNFSSSQTENLVNIEEENCITHFSQKIENKNIKISIKNSPKRPAILLTSTSWTPDEDMYILLDTFKKYEGQCIIKESKLPDLIVIITGKNPDQNWLQKLRNMNLEHIKVATLFASMEDYYKLVAVADIGICLHTSSSGLDLPMKIVDMQGVGLPVLAYYFKTIDEQITIGKNAFTFLDSEELKSKLVTLLYNFPENFDNTILNPKLKNDLYSLRKYAEENRPRSFIKEWESVAKEFF